MTMDDTTIIDIATNVAPNYGLGTDVSRSIVRKVLELASGFPDDREAGLSADLSRLKLENGKLKKLVATRERQRDTLAAKILNGSDKKVHGKPVKEKDDEDDA